LVESWTHLGTQPDGADASSLCASALASRTTAMLASAGGAPASAGGGS
jgi:hypothetical protein